jgi:hypothetical protein
MFPTGLVGVALLVLRISVAITVVINAVECRPLGVPLWIVVGLVLCALFMSFGAFTPHAAVINGLAQIGLLQYADGKIFQFITAMIGSGIVSVLGPGAYSIDSRIFGRRLLQLPPKK